MPGPQIMLTVDYRFAVDAPRIAISAFHCDTRALTPLPIFVQIRRFELLTGGSLADFTLWFGPFPVRWKAVHTGVSESGFKNTQTTSSLAKSNQTHRFTAADVQTTLIQEYIEYEYDDGVRRLFGHMLFSKPALYLLLTARKLTTRKHLHKLPAGAGVPR